MKPNPDLPTASREEIIRQLEQFSIEVLLAALGVLKSRALATNSTTSSQTRENKGV